MVTENDIKSISISDLWALITKLDLGAWIFILGLLGGCFWLGAFINDITKHKTDSNKDALLERYRRFVENSDAPNKTTLMELTNNELKKRGKNLYTKIKDFNDYYNGRRREIRARLERKEIDKAEYKKLMDEDMDRAGKEFEKEMRVDAQMVRQELRNRISPEARKHIVGLPSLNPADKRAGKVSLYDVLPAQFSATMSGQLGREIEELVKLLPDD